MTSFMRDLKIPLLVLAGIATFTVSGKVLACVSEQSPRVTNASTGKFAIVSKTYVEGVGDITLFTHTPTQTCYMLVARLRDSNVVSVSPTLCAFAGR